ncbi:MAG: 23S rRNA (guanosine(2251)-2'-O)-methyltransferase RlmB [Clostridiales bacterium]|nr:23S rRNA (guanosine(2251)-2'-O)-methyltransferase RlmB [Clostridiales bacterium]
MRDKKDVLEDKIEGRNSVLEALKSNRTINKILVAKGDREGSVKKIIALAKEKKVILQEVLKQKLDSLSDTGAHQGVIAFVSPIEYVDVSDILEEAKGKGEAPFVIILDEIEDPHNFGAILRTANAVGAHGVIVPKRRSVAASAIVSKASAGAIEYVKVARVTNIANTIDYLKEKGVWVYGIEASGSSKFYEANLKGPIAIVIGSEGRGIGKLITSKCDFLLSIPMKGEITSLNASVAGAVVMYEVLKQREI